MSSLQLQCRQEAPVTIISLHGRLDGNSSREFEAFMAAHLAGDAPQIVLDSSNLVFISSAGLRELMLLARKLGKRGGKASIIGASPLIRETLAMTGIDGLFHFTNDLEAAKKAAQGGRSTGAGFLESWFKRSS